jgi:DDE_Tnp_1-associated
VLAGVADPRHRRGVRHRLLAILGLAVCAVLGGARSFTAIAEWAADADEETLARLGVAGTVPSESTFRRTLQRLDAGAFDDLAGACSSSSRIALCSCRLIAPGVLKSRNHRRQQDVRVLGNLTASELEYAELVWVLIALVIPDVEETVGSGGDLADTFEGVEDGGAPGTTVVGLAGQVQEGRAVHPPQIEQAVVAKLGEEFLDFRDLLAQARVIVIETSRLADGCPAVVLEHPPRLLARWSWFPSRVLAFPG